MSFEYDTNNIFARILRGELECKKVMENEYLLAFHDRFPKAPVHVLVIPKGHFVNFHHLMTTAPSSEIQGFYQGINDILDTLHLKDSGYRLISNCGINGGQEVPHFHVHILGGDDIGPMINAST
jgi:histidine triad (HIT) family protein